MSEWLQARLPPVSEFGLFALEDKFINFVHSENQKYSNSEHVTKIPTTVMRNMDLEGKDSWEEPGIDFLQSIMETAFYSLQEHIVLAKCVEQSFQTIFVAKLNLLTTSRSRKFCCFIIFCMNMNLIPHGKFMIMATNLRNYEFFIEHDILKFLDWLWPTLHLLLQVPLAKYTDLVI